VFVVNDRDADVELIDRVYDDLDVRASESPKFDPLPDLHLEAAPLLSEDGAGKQGADTDSSEYLFHCLWPNRARGERQSLKRAARGSLLAVRSAGASSPKPVISALHPLN
jgi:hypothetical protein